MDNKEKTPFETGRSAAIIFGAVVYAGVVVAATTLFVSFILSAFPDNAYFSRVVMGIAGVLVGCSTLAFPFALHKWAVGGTHRNVAIFLYYGEIAIMAINSVVSFATLYARESGATAPEWVARFVPFSIASIIYTLAAWGTLFQLDPIASATASANKAQQDFDAAIARKKVDFVNSVEGEKAIADAAQLQIKRQFDPKNYAPERKHFGNAPALPDVAYAEDTEAATAPRPLPGKHR